MKHLTLLMLLTATDSYASCFQIPRLFKSPKLTINDIWRDPVNGLLGRAELPATEILRQYDEPLRHRLLFLQREHVKSKLDS